MNKHYRDYGSIIGKDVYTIPKTLTLIDYNPKGEIYKLTHDGEGKSLSFMDKAFISFTYGGKKIEDFGLIVTSVDNRYNGESPPGHEDFVSDARMLNGQYYWGSHYNAREMLISLATDGMTQEQLDKFKYWFQAGEIKLLIMALHPNRGILARVSTAPNISIVPFKRKKRTIINGKEIEVTIAEYKGNIQLNLVMDEPFWYAIYNVFGTYNKLENGQVVIVDKWTDVNGNIVELLDDDALKIMVEDHIPSSGMVNDSIHFSEYLNLLYYNPYKYTLTTEDIGLILFAQGVIGGTPVVNQVEIVDDKEIESLLYPLSGAVIGPLYGVSGIDNEKITSILNNWVIKDRQLNNEDGHSERLEYEEDEEVIYSHIIIKEYLPVRSGTIIFKNEQISNKLKIVFYKKQNNVYIRDTTKDIVTMSVNLPIYNIVSPTYIRLELITEINSNNNNVDFNDFISIELYTFNTSINGEILTNNDTFNYFYSGTAPSHPIMNFSIPIVFDENGYINTFNNSYTQKNNGNNYNMITLLSEFSHVLKITNPSIFNSYNKVIQKLHSNTEENVVELIQWFRNEIGHQAVRNWIINCINIYYNNELNLDEKDQKIIIGVLGKKYLLNCMPYLFASALLANITIKELSDIPNIIKHGEQLLGEITFESNYKRLPIEKDNESGIYKASGFVNLPLTITATVLNKNALFYEWHYSRNKIEWYQMEDNWYDDTTATLKCDYLLLSDNEIYLRCVISNNVYTVGKEEENIIQIKLVSDDLEITRAKSSYTLTQNQSYNSNSSTKIYWNITGEYIYQILDGVDYRPRLYYQMPQSNTWNRWGDTNITLEELSFCNQIDTPTLSLNGNKIYLYLTPRENLNKELRNTKFKVRLYKISANNQLLDSNNYVLSNEITIAIKRLLIDNAQVSMIPNRNGTIFPEKTTFIERLEFYHDTNFDMTVSNISNSRTNTVGYMQISSLTLNSWNSFNLTFDNSNNSFSYNWSLSDNIINTYGKTFFIRFSFTDYEETYYLPNETGIEINEIDVSQATATISEFETDRYTHAYYILDSNLHTDPENNSKILAYVGDYLKIYIKENNNIPDVAEGKFKLEYDWYYNSTLTNGLFIMNNSTHIGSTVSHTNIHGDAYYQISSLNFNNAGYYKARATLAIQLPGGNTYRTPIDITPEGYLTVSVIDHVIIDLTITCNMDNWIYYSQETDNKWSDSENNIIDFSNGKTLELTCIVNSGFTNDCTVTAYRTRSNTIDTYNTNKNLTITQNGNFTEIKLSLSYTSSQQKVLYTNNNGNNNSFQFVISDKYNNLYYSNYKQITFISKNKRLIIITNYTKSSNIEDTWLWPVTLQNLTACYVDLNGELISAICPHITSTYEWQIKNGHDALVISGIPRSNTPSQDPDPTTNRTSNEIAADLDYDWPKNLRCANVLLNGYALYRPNPNLDEYKKELQSGTRSIKKGYVGYNANYKTILSINPQQYKSIKIILAENLILDYANTNTGNNNLYKYKVRMVQGDTILAESEYIGQSLTLQHSITNSNVNIELQVLFCRETTATQKAWGGKGLQFHAFDDNVMNMDTRSGESLRESNFSNQFDTWKQTATLEIESIIGMF